MSLGAGLRIHFVLGLTPMISIVPDLQTAEHTSELVSTVWEVQGVAPVVRLSHGHPLVARWRLMDAATRSSRETSLRTERIS